MEKYLKCSDLNNKKIKYQTFSEAPGFYLIKDFITSEEEIDILNELDSNFELWEFNKNRRIQSYGPLFDDRFRVIKEDKSIRQLPAFAKNICNKITHCINMMQIFPGICM